MSDFTDEQKDFMEKPVIVILPSFNGEWIIETYTYDGTIQGRFNAEDTETALAALQAALTDRNDTNFGIN